MSSMKRPLGKPEESAEWEEQHLGYQPRQAAIRYSPGIIRWTKEEMEAPYHAQRVSPRDCTLSGKKKAETKIIHERRTSTRSRKAWVYQVLHQARAQAVQRCPWFNPAHLWWYMQLHRVTAPSGKRSRRNSRSTKVWERASADVEGEGKRDSLTPKLSEWLQQEQHLGSLSG